MLSLIAVEVGSRRFGKGVELDKLEIFFNFLGRPSFPVEEVSKLCLRFEEVGGGEMRWAVVDVWIVYSGSVGAD